MQHLHFISGLPRSGSTLLSALLAQNPRFHAGDVRAWTCAASDLFQRFANDAFWRGPARRPTAPRVV